MDVIEQSLKMNPNHFDSLWTKAICLEQNKKIYEQIHEQNQFQEALIYYEKALMINPNDQQTKDNIDECLKALKEK